MVSGEVKLWGCGSWRDCAIELWIDTYGTPLLCQEYLEGTGSQCDITVSWLLTLTEARRWHRPVFSAPTFPLESPYDSLIISLGGASGPPPLSLCFSQCVRLVSDSSLPSRDVAVAPSR